MHYVYIFQCPKGQILAFTRRAKAVGCLPEELQALAIEGLRSEGRFIGDGYKIHKRPLR